MNQQILAMPNMLFPSFFGVTSSRDIPAQGFPAQDFRSSFNVFSAMRQALRNRGHAMPITVMGRADFIHHVTLHLPDVAARIEEDDFGVLHLEMGAMKLATQEAIVRYEFHTVRRHFSFIAYLFEHADHMLDDAIRVSYLEGLFIGEASPEYENARCLLPENLMEALKKAELRYKLFVLQTSPRQPRR